VVAGQLLSLIPICDTVAEGALVLGCTRCPFGHGIDIDERLGDWMRFHASGKKGAGRRASTFGTHCRVV
jgi:hypothetical protein